MTEKTIPIIATTGAIVSVVAALIGIWNNVESEHREQQKQELEVRVADREYMLRVTDKVFDSLSKSDVRQQRIAASLIETLNSSDYKTRLRTAMLSGAAAPVVVQQVRHNIKIEGPKTRALADPVRAITKPIIGVVLGQQHSQVLPPAPMTDPTNAASMDTGKINILGDNLNYSFDIYYCNDEQRADAAGLANMLRQDSKLSVTLSYLSLADQERLTVHDNVLESGIVEKRIIEEVDSIITNFADISFSNKVSPNPIHNHFRVYYCGLSFEQQHPILN